MKAKKARMLAAYLQALLFWFSSLLPDNFSREWYLSGIKKSAGLTGPADYIITVETAIVQLGFLEAIFIVDIGLELSFFIII